MESNRLKELRESVGLSQKKMAGTLGISESAYQNYEYGIREIPSRVIARACETYGCNFDWLVGLDEESSSLISGKLVPPPALRPFKNSRSVKGMEMGYVPLRGRVHAGPFTYPESLEAREELVLAPQFLIDADPDLYACEVEGDCMNKVYPEENCIIFVSPNKEPQNGSIAVVTLDGCDALVRRMYRTPHTLVLSPESWNEEHSDIVITQESDHTIEFGGKVVWFQSGKEME